VLIQPDDKIVVSGTAHAAVLPTERPTLIRYLPDGTLDSTFVGGGVMTGFLVGVSTTADDVLRQPDGKLVAVGLSSSNVRNGFAVMRFLDDGTPDGTFGAGGGTFIEVALATTPASWRWRAKATPSWWSPERPRTGRLGSSTPV
jgi:uncharacterized delta-60 repeat protein